MRGSCLCGEIIYEITRIVGINYCHCRQCQKASGTAFATSAAVPREGFSIVEGEASLGAFESSPGKRRCFCKVCSSPLFSERQGSTMIYIRLGALDDIPSLTPEVHIHVSSKAPWYEIHDDLPQLQAEEGLWF